VALFHKAEWTELAITQEINRVLEENTLSYSMVRAYPQIFILSKKEIDTPIVRESERDFSLDDGIAIVLSPDPFHPVAEFLRR
jgi:hypothetical protein